MWQEQLTSTGRKVNINLNFTFSTKIHFNWITDLIVKHKIINHLGKKKENSHDIRSDEESFNLIPKVLSIKDKIEIGLNQK